MPDLRRPGRAVRAPLAAAGLALWLAAGPLLAQALPQGAALDARQALAISQGAVGKTLGDYSLKGADGRPVRLSAFRGRPLVVQFIYTGCFQVCPTATRTLGRAVAQAQRALGTNSFMVVSVGFNLPFDDPTAMREFRRRQGIDAPNWEFLAADAAALDGMARDLGFVWAPTASGFDHVTQLTILDARGRVVRQVYGDDYAPSRLVGPLEELVTGAPSPAQNLDGLIERIRILCTIYDPLTGRYRLDYGLFIEILTGLTVLGAIAAYLTLEWRRQRSARPAR
jgi:protein SCO1/2